MYLKNKQALKKEENLEEVYMTDNQFKKFLRLLLATIEKCKTVEEVKQEIEKLLQE